MVTSDIIDEATLVMDSQLKLWRAYKLTYRYGFFEDNPLLYFES